MFLKLKWARLNDKDGKVNRHIWVNQPEDHWSCKHSPEIDILGLEKTHTAILANVAFFIKLAKTNQGSSFIQTL